MFSRLTLEDIVAMVNNILRGLFANICEIIYPWIANLYDIFKDLGNLVYSDQFTQIYNKISLIIGIFMVFRVTFWLIESLINPDTINDKEKNPGKIIQKVMFAILLLAITPAIFEAAFKLQNKIVSSNIIENIISTEKVSGDNSTTIGRNLAANLFVNFYTPTVIEGEEEVMQVNDDCISYTGVNGLHADYLRQYGKLTYLDNACLTKKDDINKDGEEEFIIDFNGLFAVGVGIFVCWILLMYCISLGTRYIQLIYLQVIAPIPIMCYLAPSKDNMFSKWLKQCTTTYLDLFIRIAIINFAMFLCNLLLSNDNGIILNSAIGTSKGWITLFLVLGLLTFAKKAPDLVQELLPKSVTKASGDFGLSLKKRTDSMLGGKLAYGASKMAAFGGIAAATTGAIGFLGGRGTGRLTGMLGGMARGFTASGKEGSIFKNMNNSIKQQTERNKQKIDWNNNDSHLYGRMKQRAANALGFQGPAERFENEIGTIDNKIETFKNNISLQKRKVSAYKEISSGKSSMEDRAESKLLKETYDPVAKPIRYGLQKNVLRAKATLEHLQQTGASADDILEAQLAYNATLKKAKEEYITAVIKGEVNDAAMESMLEHIKNVVRTNQDNAFEGMGHDFKKAEDNFADYKDLDDYEANATTRKNEAIEGKYIINEKNEKEFVEMGINQVENEIKSLEDKKAEIKATEEYKRANADRSAVGGHSGKK